MPNTTRPLPTVIGQTENALRAVLLAVLSSTPIEGYEEWVALNVVERGIDPQSAAALASALAIEEPAARRVLDVLIDKHLLGSDGVSDQLSGPGSEHLRQARTQIGAVVARLVEGLSAADIDVTLRVLDHVRAKAEHEFGQPLLRGR